MPGLLDVFDGLDLNGQLDRFRQSDAERQSLVENIVKQYEKLQYKYLEKCNDYDNEVQSRRLWQTQYETARREKLHAENGIDSNPFVLALIDGDGAIFQDALLKEGRDGGADAAHRLLTEIKQYVQANFENAGAWSVMVQVYTNLEGLGRKLFSLGMISSPTEIHAFSRAFSLNQPLFSIIDVGFGKERADHKLKEFFRFFVQNVQCKHIIFGGTHDNGYLPNLDPYKKDTLAAKRITLLQSAAIQPGFRELGFPIVRFDSVFRPTDLPERPSGVSASPVYGVTSAMERQPSHSGSTPTPMSVTPSLAGDSKNKSSWATVGKNGAVEKSINIASPKFVPRRTILLNSMDERVDAPLAKAERPAIDYVNEQTKINKFCNEHHLTGECRSQYCPYVHGQRLGPTEQLALRWKARQRSCQLGNACRSFDCFWGHQCQGENLGYGCLYGNGCHFARMHGKDLHAAMKYFEDGTIDVIH
ncbi:C-x8-C-x5-C-x3-H type zinc finger protein [Viridothelium virens]|uniref:C-x8-C-x5-C-x3-H type zinc finger protein n=1 Tax=Viridothelium virens TaxID=1048519 RepID=A0A6A6HGF0_VIRVR|nr:C-x8-C-x5-C-x3-H type zinc finger protein [Viridothelium virens]